MRASWTRLTTSRARPSRRSSGLTVVSIATVSPASVATAQPSRGVCVTITSSAPTTTGPTDSTDPADSTGPADATVTVPPARTARAISPAGAALIAAATAGVRAPNRRPSARKFGFTV